MKKVVYYIYSPAGERVMACISRKGAKKVLNEYNKHIPSWHYDELYKYQSEVTDVDSLCFKLVCRGVEYW